MYRRDFGILFLSLFAIFWALQHEGTYQYYPAFYHQFDHDPDYLDTPGVLPPPLVVRSAQVENGQSGDRGKLAQRFEAP